MNRFCQQVPREVLHHRNYKYTTLSSFSSPHPLPIFLLVSQQMESARKMEEKRGEIEEEKGRTHDFRALLLSFYCWSERRMRGQSKD